MAVIAAALAAYLDIPESNLKIKSIKRVNNNSGWGISAIENEYKDIARGSKNEKIQCKS